VELGKAYEQVSFGDFLQKWTLSFRA